MDKLPLFDGESQTLAMLTLMLDGKLAKSMKGLLDGLEKKRAELDIEADKKFRTREREIDAMRLKAEDKVSEADKRAAHVDRVEAQSMAAAQARSDKLNEREATIAAGLAAHNAREAELTRKEREYERARQKLEQDQAAHATAAKALDDKLSRLKEIA